MTEPIDVDALLAPLESGEQGAGTDLRSDYSATSPYQRLRDARAAARAEERARDAEGDSDGQEAAGWRDVFSVGQQALAGQSKDFEIAAWLTEAMVRLHGLSGLTAGARLITGLCETYWDSGFPQPDEDGYEGRSSPIGGLSGAGADGTIMQPLRRLALFRRADGSPIGVYQWEQSEQVEAMDPKRQKARYEAGTPELKALEAEARLDRPYLTGLGRQLGPAIAAWKAMETALDQRFGAESPSIRKVSGLLDRMLEIVGRLGGLVAAEEAVVEVAAEGGEAVATGGGGGGGGGGPLQNREAALRELDRIAEFFRRTEPHSPLAYTLEEAVRRGRMTLAELLTEVLPDADVRNQMLWRLGIKPEEQS